MDDDRTRIYQHPKLGDGLPIQQGNSLPAGSTLRGFDIEKTLGIGGFGIVYLARDPLLDRKVAIKEYLPSSLAFRAADRTIRLKTQSEEDLFLAGMRSFVNEAQTLAKLDHSGLVKVLQFWEENGTAYMVMPYYQGRTLGEANSDKALANKPVLLPQMWQDLLETLEYLHQQNIYHRDISPDNIFLLDTGKPLLLDFGAARKVVDQQSSQLTVLLKPGYAPIEQYGHSGEQGAWTDIYATSVVFYQLITETSPPASVTRIINDTLKPLSTWELPDYPSGFLHAIDAGLEIKPQNRPQTVAEWRNLASNTNAQSPSSVDTFASHTNATVSPQMEIAQPSLPDEVRPPLRSKQNTKIANLGKPKWLILAVVSGLAVLVSAGLYRQSNQEQSGPLKSVAPIAAQEPHKRVVEHIQPPAPSVSTPQIVESGLAPPVTPEKLPLIDALLAKRSSAWQVILVPKKEQFRIGADNIDITASSEKDGYLYYLTQDPKWGIVLIPQNGKQNSKIYAGEERRLPSPEAADPAGPQTFVAVITRYPRIFSNTQLQPLKIRGQNTGYFYMPNELVSARATDFFGTPQCPPNVEEDNCHAFSATKVTVQIYK